MQGHRTFVHAWLPSTDSNSPNHEHKMTNQVWTSLALVVALPMLIGCGAEQAPTNQEQPAQPTSNPTPLAPPPAPAVETASTPRPAAKTLRWVGCGITKKAFMHALATEYEKASGTKITLEGGGATRGIRDVAAGNTDLGGSCRHKILDPQELDCELHPVGWDAVVAIVHPDNPLSDISVEQLRGVFTGRIRSWSQLGGADVPIEVLIRTGKTSGVGLMGRELLFADPELDYLPEAVEFKSSGPLEQALEQRPHAIALTGISSAKKRAVKVLQLAGSTPSMENLIAGRYSLVRPLYLVTAKKPRAEVTAFLDFMQSPRGQAVIEREGTVPLATGARLWTAYRERIQAANERR